jgi:predicted nucleic acid-binding protein
MIVVADTSPVQYLVRIGAIHLLETLYGGITIPDAVLQELQAQDGPLPVRAWSSSLPSWVQVHSVRQPLTYSQSNLHRGEREAIALAEEIHATLLLIDDRAGAQVALNRGLTITGTLGVLVEAAQRGFT